MTSTLWKLGTKNDLETKLDGNITADSTSINVLSTTGFQAPGIMTIDATDQDGNPTSASREYVSFTGITNNTFTGCSRGLGGSTAQSHSNGAKVEETWTVTHWEDFIAVFEESHSSAGQITTTSPATLAEARINRYLNASGASLTVSDLVVQNSIDATNAAV